MRLPPTDLFLRSRLLGHLLPRSTKLGPRGEEEDEEPPCPDTTDALSPDA
jgi:hypothetical protein